MAPLPRNTIQHFTHNHPLTKVYENKEFLCDGCRTVGSGTRYRCHGCDFDLHEHCSACPTVFSSFMHPLHSLSLVLRHPQATRQNFHACDVCGDLVEGLFYRCQLCDFDVHPICTQLPEHVKHVMHPNHLLKLQSFHPGWCMVCKAPCNLSTPRFVPPATPPPSLACYSPNSVVLPRLPYAHGFPSIQPYFDPRASRLTSSSSHGQGDVQKKIMYNIAGKLAVGVLSNMIFGTFFS